MATKPEMAAEGIAENSVLCFNLHFGVGGVNMGYQESFLFCKDMNDLTKLCKILNRAAAKTSENGLKNVGLSIFEVARLKKDIKVQFISGEVTTLPKGTYFVWWGGERGPQIEDIYLLSVSSVVEPYWYTVFAEYVPVARTLLAGIEQGRPGEIQENKWIRTLHPDDKCRIIIEKLEEL